MSLPNILGNRVSDIPKCASLYQDVLFLANERSQFLQENPTLLSTVQHYLQEMKNFSRKAYFEPQADNNPFMTEYTRFRISSTIELTLESCNRIRI